MGNYTKVMRQQMEEINKRIVDGHRRGVCDKNGYSEKDENGVFRARLNNHVSSVTKKLCNRCHQWYYIYEDHTCFENVE